MPALAFARPRAWLSTPAIVGATLAALLGAWVLHKQHAAGLPMQLTVGNYLTQIGALGNDVTSGYRPLLFSPAVWTLIQWATGLAGLALGAELGAAAGRLARGRRNITSESIVYGFGLLTVAVLLLRAAQGGVVVDRYLFGLLAVCALFITGPRDGVPAPPWRSVLACVLAVAIAVVSTVSVLNCNSFATARWDAGRAFVARGVPAERVDAGFEWSGLRAGGSAGDGSGWKPPSSWYAPRLPAGGNCALVTTSSLSDRGLRPEGTHSYEAYPGGPQHRLFLYVVPEACRAAGVTPPSRTAGG